MELRVLCVCTSAFLPAWGCCLGGHYVPSSCVTHTGLLHRVVDRQVLAALEGDDEHEPGRTVPISMGTAMSGSGLELGK